MIFFLVFYLSASIARGWSGDAHRVTARLAFEMMRPSAVSFLALHLCAGDESQLQRMLIDVSTYADTIDWSHDFHFSHTPFRECSAFDLDRDCGLGGSGKCIVTAIGNYTQRASDLSLPAEERTDALKFLVHFLADIHNPLHVGFAEDEGGNFIHLSNPAGKSLHNVWDYVLVNRKQVELGVFKANEEDVSEPWRLSDALLDQIHDKRSQHAYTLGVSVEDVSSLEAATALAARMASQTATEYTCKLGYSDIAGNYIENGRSLDEDYLGSRADTAMELLKFSGVRLAEVVNMIAVRFYRNVREESAKMNVARGSVETSNQYLVLAGVFDPEASLFDVSQDGGDVADVVVDDNDGEFCDPSKYKTESVQAEVVSEFDSRNEIEEEERIRLKRAEKNRKKKQKKRAQSMNLYFEGVDLRQVVLIRREGEYFITGRHFAKNRNYVPTEFKIYSVLFEGNREARPIHILLDVGFFKRHILSDELITKCLMRIGNLDGTVDGPVLSFSTTSSGIAPLAGPFQRMEEKVADKIDEPRMKEDKKKAKRDLKNQIETATETMWAEKDEICLFMINRVILLLHRDTLTDPAIPMIRANQHSVLFRGSSIEEDTCLLVDHRINAFDTTQYLDPLLTYLRASGASTLGKQLKGHRPTLDQELRDIYEIVHGTDAERVKRVEAIKYMKMSPARDDEAYFIYEWSIRREDLIEAKNT